jgi:hypothetical protein
VVAAVVATYRLWVLPRRRFVISCTECGAVSVSSAGRAWRAYRIDDVELDEEPALAFYCPVCAVAEFGQPVRGRETTQGRRWRDANKPDPARFKIALDTAVALTVADAELATAFDVVAAAGGSVVSVVRGGDAERTRVELELEAQNDGHARRLASELLDALGGVTPSVPGGWVVSSLDSS